MNHHGQPVNDPNDLPPIAIGHEPSEVGIKRIFIFGISMVVAGLIIVFLLREMMIGFKGEETILARSKPALFTDQSGQFPEPQLQRNTTYDMTKFREAESARLGSYGWVEPKAGVARIPIERALAIVAERGLPQPKPQAKPESESATESKPKTEAPAPPKPPESDKKTNP